MGKTKTPQWPQHRMGQRCGYELFEDGSIQPARSHSQPLDELSDREHAVRTLLGHVTDHCSTLLREINKERRRVWLSICQDYGIDLAANDVSYSGYDDRIYIRPKAEEHPEAAP